jgi:hypothetical protein
LSSRRNFRQRRRLGAAGNVAEVLLGRLPHLVDRDVAGHDDRRVVRHIKLLVERQHVIGRRRVEIVHAADHRVLVRWPVGGQRIEGNDAQPPLLFHHLALAIEVLRRDRESRHPIRLEPEGEFESVRRQSLEVSRSVVVRRAVVGAARRQDVPLELARLEVLCLLEEHVLEQVSKARAADLLVGTPDVVPDVHRDHRRRVVLVHDDG